MLAHSKTGPGSGLTLGIADLLAARKILLLFSGPHKRGPVRRLFHPKISTHFPASFLWLHPKVTCLCDRPAVPGDAPDVFNPSTPAAYEKTEPPP